MLAMLQWNSINFIRLLSTGEITVHHYPSKLIHIAHTQPVQCPRPWTMANEQCRCDNKLYVFASDVMRRGREGRNNISTLLHTRKWFMAHHQHLWEAIYAAMPMTKTLAQNKCPFIIMHNKIKSMHFHHHRRLRRRRRRLTTHIRRSKFALRLRLAKIQCKRKQKLLCAAAVWSTTTTVRTSNLFECVCGIFRMPIVNIISKTVENTFAASVRAWHAYDIMFNTLNATQRQHQLRRHARIWMRRKVQTELHTQITMSRLVLLSLPLSLIPAFDSKQATPAHTRTHTTQENQMRCWEVEWCTRLEASWRQRVFVAVTYICDAPLEYIAFSLM